LDLGPVPAFTGAQCADCGSRFGLEYDHINPVANKGETRYENVEARCWADHQAKTERDRQAGLLMAPPAVPAMSAGPPSAASGDGGAALEASRLPNEGVAFWSYPES
jgi:5-methylcytosine-specific restriction endonuclease McrA